eukprot:TRINITY_DN8_c0_g1_i3.p1 TRINITY_DN8_c0_g1~~TRINITY_DN8_c0_g1_i3.p1  ORF type:complete len:270 (+),score=59.93 TRINITY_DN8_c0_g1_i3:2-811(+)
MCIRDRYMGNKIRMIPSNKIAPEVSGRKNGEVALQIDNYHRPAFDEESRVDSDERVDGKSHGCIRCCGIFFYIMVVIFAFLYMAGISFYFTDKKGKEVYFKEDPDGKEYTINEAIIVKQTNPSWSIRTEDWGHFYRAFVKDNSNSFWEKYDCLLSITITAGVVGVLWIITAVFNMYKYCGTRFDLSCKGLVLNIVTLAVFIGGTVQPAYYIIKFYRNTRDFWDQASNSTRSKYFISDQIYGGTTGFLMIFGIIVLICDIVFACIKPSNK